MRSELRKLLKQLMFKKISPDEFYKLRSGLKDSSEEDIETVMEQLWTESDFPPSLPLSTQLRVLKKIKRTSSPTVSYIYKFLKIASIIAFPLLVTLVPYLYFSEKGTKRFASATTTSMTIMTDKGQKTHIILPDGSKVWLNAESTLDYPPDFGHDSRTVKLTGEGYFEVQEDDNLEFRVETKHINVVVHGTKFNINAFDTSQDTYISLIEGSISVEDKNSIRLATLQPNNSIKLNNTDTSFEIIEENTELASLWSLNKWKVDNVTTKELFTKMSYWYGVKIHLEGDYKQHYYTFTIKNESLREFLSLINELTPIAYDIKGEEVYIRYK